MVLQPEKSIEILKQLDDLFALVHPAIKDSHREDLYEYLEKFFWDRIENKKDLLFLLKLTAVNGDHVKTFTDRHLTEMMNLIAEYSKLDENKALLLLADYYHLKARNCEDKPILAELLYSKSAATIVMYLKDNCEVDKDEISESMATYLAMLAAAMSPQIMKDNSFQSSFRYRGNFLKSDLFGFWEPREFLITPTSIEYYKFEKKNYSLKGKIQFSIIRKVSKIQEIERKGYYGFKIKTGNSTHRISAPSDRFNDLNEFAQSIKMVLQWFDNLVYIYQNQDHEKELTSLFHAFIPDIDELRSIDTQFIISTEGQPYDFHDISIFF